MGLRLNLGCGKQVLVGWENLDPKTNISPLVKQWCWNTDLPFESSLADVVLIQHSLQHCRPEDYDKNFIEVLRVLKPGGKVVVKEADDRYYIWHHPGVTDSDGLIASSTSEPEMISVLTRNGFISINTDRQDIVSKYGDAINRVRRVLHGRNLFVVEAEKPTKENKNE